MFSRQSIFTTALPPLSNCLTIGPSKDSFSIRSLTSCGGEQATGQSQEHQHWDWSTLVQRSATGVWTVSKLAFLLGSGHSILKARLQISAAHYVDPLTFPVSRYICHSLGQTCKDPLHDKREIKKKNPQNVMVNFSYQLDDIQNQLKHMPGGV